MRGPVLLLLLTVGIYWKLVLSGGQYTWLNSPDLSTQVLPWLEFQAREWNRGQFPLWDPYNWGGQSLAGRTEPGVMYPLNWILFGLPLDGGVISRDYLNWYYVLTRYLGALFCYLLCRDLGRTVAASLLGGIAFGLAGYVGNVGWPQMANGAVWGPLVILFFLRAMREDRPYWNAALGGGFLGISLLSGHHQAPVLIGLVVAGLWVYHAVSGGRWRQLAAVAVVFACFVLLLGAAQILPSLEYGSRSVRWVGARNDPVEWGEKIPYHVHHWLSMHPVSVLALVLPGMDKDYTLFLGLVVVALALAGVVTGWGRKEVRLFGAVAAGGLLFAFGSASIFHGWIYALVPVVDKARNAAAGIYVFDLGAAVLAAYGLEALGDPERRAAPFFGRLAAGLLAWSGLLYIGLLAVFLAAGGKVFDHWRLSTAPFAALLAGAALLAWRRGALSGRAAQASLILVLLFELGNSTGADFKDRETGWEHLDKLAEHREVAAYLRRQPGVFRVDIDRAEIPFNFGEWHEIEECGGNSGVTTNVFRASGRRHAHLLLGEKFAVGRKPRWEGQTEVYQAPGGLKVYQNPETFPRVWTVHEVEGLANRSEITARLARPLEELRRRALVAGPAPPVEACAGDEVELVERTRNSLRLRARMRCRGMVVVGDTWYPGWVATAGGREVPTHEVYGFLRGVVVEAGEQEIRLRYRPRSVFAGAALTALGILAFVGMSLLHGKGAKTQRKPGIMVS